jgi:hypothetical protein
MAFNQVPSSSGGDISSRITDAKGDIIAATSADVVSRLGVGSDGQVLTAASGQTTGLQWSTPATGGMTLLASGTFSNYTNITSLAGQDYVSMRMIMQPRSNSNYGSYVNFLVNNAQGSSYEQPNSAQRIDFGHSTVGQLTSYTSGGLSFGGRIYTSDAHSIVVDLPSTKAGYGSKLAYALVRDADSQIRAVFMKFGKATAAITSIQITGPNQGSYQLYGIK